MIKHCSAEGCRHAPVIRVQPFKRATWNMFCNEHWVALALATVKEAHDCGFLVVDKPPQAPSHLRIIDTDAQQTL